MRWWRAARLEDHGGSSWQRQKRLAEEGRWDELFPGPGRDVDEGRRGAAPLSRRRYRIDQSPEFAETAARLSPKAKRWLAEIYQVLAVTRCLDCQALMSSRIQGCPTSTPSRSWMVT